MIKIIISLFIIILGIYLFLNYQKSQKFLKDSHTKLNKFNKDFKDISNTEPNNIENKIELILQDKNIHNLPNGIKGLITQKIYNHNCEIKIDNQLSDNSFVKYSSKKLNNLIISLSSVLDNAIEASSQMDNPLITLSLYENKKHIFIKVGNNFQNSIDLDKLGTKYYSTKKNQLGLGLFTLKRNGIEKHINITNNFFSITLELKRH